MILYQDCSSHLDSSKNMAARGRGLFSPYIYIENFKNLLVRNHWPDFHIILQKCSFGDPVCKIVQAIWICQKTWPPGGRGGGGGRWRGLFSLYIFMENFKNLLIRNHWTDFHMILQKCSSGDPVARSCHKRLDRFQYNLAEMFP